MRSAEKSRKSSCLFSNKISNLSIQEYFKECPSSLLSTYQQTVLSSFIIENKQFQSFQVVSFGVGTKYLKSSYLCTNQINGNLINDNTPCNNNHKKNKKKISKKHLFVVRDCHAEILARRGLILYLENEIKLFLKETIEILRNQPEYDILTINHPLFQYVFIHSSSSSFPLKRSLDDDNNEDDDDEKEEEGTRKNKNNTFQLKNIKIKIKDDIYFHMYSSSSPCGNSCNKRWAKGQTIRTFDDLNENEYPLQPHPRLYVTALQEGQVSILMKTTSSPLGPAEL